MPFINEERRKDPDMQIPGDRCFIYYREMMRVWRLNPRWTTVDEIAKTFFVDDQLRAAFLAFMVFFNREAMPYEEQKAKENGEV
jgi:hypothetical protein